VQVRTFKSAAGTMEATSCRVMTPALVLAPECEGKVPHNMSHSRTYIFFVEGGTVNNKTSIFFLSHSRNGT